MSSFFPHVDTVALKKFAAAAAAGEHAYRLNRNATLGQQPPATGKKKGKGKAQDKSPPYPVVVGCEDTYHVGEQMILITFDPESVPLGPYSMVAHFPRGRPTYTTKALVGMTQVVRDHAQIIAPKIYGYYDNIPNPINAEVVLLELLQGECLEDVWMGLEPRHRPVLLGPLFDEGPLIRMEPQEALTSTHDYLLALAQRPERIFNGPDEDPDARNLGWPDSAPLTDADVAALRATWKRLGYLISYHSGGFYIPGSLSPDARFTAYSVLQSKGFGVRHGDMQMARFVVRWARPGDTNSDATLALTGWEHAARAPLWACARMPPWLYPHVHPYERITWEGQRNVRQFIFHSIFHGDFIPQARAWEWIVAYVYGATERWFEGLVGAHWGFRDAAEVLLVRLREHWIRERPDVPFPLEVGGAHLRGTPAATTVASAGVREPGEDSSETNVLPDRTRTFTEEMRAAMNTLANEMAAVDSQSWSAALRAQYYTLCSVNGSWYLLASHHWSQFFAELEIQTWVGTRAALMSKPQNGPESCPHCQIGQFDEEPGRHRAEEEDKKMSESWKGDADGILVFPRCSLHKRSRIRAFFAEGVDKLHLPWVVEILPVLLHVSLFLFFSGLVVFLFGINHTVFTVVMSWVGFCAGLYLCITFMPIFRHDSPYYTPLSSSAWICTTSFLYVVSRYLHIIAAHKLFSYRCFQRSLYSKKAYHKWFRQGMSKTVEMSALLLSSPSIDSRALLWTFESLDEDHEVEQFFAGIAGFKDPDQAQGLLEDFIYANRSRMSDSLFDLMIRTSSWRSLVSENVKRRRMTICMKALHAAPSLVDRRYLHQIAMGNWPDLLSSVDFGMFVRRWCRNEDREMEFLAQCIVSRVIAAASERNEPWLNLVAYQLSKSKSAVRGLLAHGDSVSRTMRELQKEFCGMWNQLVHGGQNSEGYLGHAFIRLALLRGLDKVHAALHENADAASAITNARSASGHSREASSSYSLCPFGDHPSPQDQDSSLDPWSTSGKADTVLGEISNSANQGATIIVSRTAVASRTSHSLSGLASTVSPLDVSQPHAAKHHPLSPSPSPSTHPLDATSTSGSDDVSLSITVVRPSLDSQGRNSRAGTDDTLPDEPTSVSETPSSLWDIKLALLRPDGSERPEHPSRDEDQPPRDTK
ncbi:hypothetical protein BC834DRAFT_843290 [Gloeopeniophorella convolvens]|nr:hypothetical protein BC834DRAFT_843290 [Gloeopeniophorella convolvens]